MSPPFASDPHIDSSDIAAVTTTVSRNVTHLASLNSDINALTSTVDANKTHQENVNVANQNGQTWQNSVLANKASIASVTALTSVVDDKLTSRYCQVHGDASSAQKRLYKIIINSQKSTPNEKGDGSATHTDPYSTLQASAEISLYSDLPSEFHTDGSDSYNNWRLYMNWSTSAVTSGGFTPQIDGIKVLNAGTYKCVASVYVPARNYYSVGDWTAEPTNAPDLVRVNLCGMLYVNHPGNANNGDPSNLTTALADIGTGGGKGRFGPVGEISASNVATHASHLPSHAMGSWSCIKVLSANDVVGVQLAQNGLQQANGNYEYIANGSYTFLSLELV